MFCIAILNNAQEPTQSIIHIEYTIKASDYNNGSNESQILASLSINNIKNINQVRIYLKTELLLNVQRDEKGHLFAYMKMINSN